MVAPNRVYRMDRQGVCVLGLGLGLGLGLQLGDRRFLRRLLLGLWGSKRVNVSHVSIRVGVGRKRGFLRLHYTH